MNMSNLDKFLYYGCLPVVVAGMGYAVFQLNDQLEDMEVDRIIIENEIYAERLAIASFLRLSLYKGDAIGDVLEHLEQSSFAVDCRGEIEDVIIDAIRFTILGGEEYPEYGNCTYEQQVNLVADWTAFTTRLPDFLQVSRTVFGSNKVDEELIRGKVPEVRFVCDNSFADLKNVAYLFPDAPFQINVKLSYFNMDNCDRQDTLAHEFGHMFFDVNMKEHDRGVDKVYRLGNRFGDKCRQSLNNPD